MSFSNFVENKVLALWLTAQDWDGVAVNDTTSPLTNLYEGLHTADPGEGGTQSTSETTYGAYARQAVPRSASGFTVTGNSAVHAAIVAFPEATSGTATITHFSIGAASSGTGELQGSGTVSPNISVSTTVTPRLGTGTAITVD